MWEPDPHSRTATPAHRQWRAQVLRNSGGHCQLRYPNRCTGIATEADHIIEVADGGPEFDVTNGQGVCAACHAHKTALHANRTRWSKHHTSTKHPNEQHPGLR
jgi:hypothetical protein